MASEPMNEALSKSREMANTLKIVHQKHVESSKKYDDELAAHELTKNNLRLQQQENDKKLEEQKRVLLQHSETRSRLAAVEIELDAYKKRVGDAEKNHEAAMKELELQRATVASEQAAKAAEVKGLEDKHQAAVSKLAQRNVEFEQVNEQHASIKSQLDAALRAQEAYRKEYHATVEALREAKEEAGRHAEEVAKLRAERDAVNTQLKASASLLEEARANLSERDARLTNATAELDEHRRKARQIQDEFDQVQDMVKEHRP